MPSALWGIIKDQNDSFIFIEYLINLLIKNIFELVNAFHEET